MNIAATVILFNPEGALAKRILSYAHEVDKLYIMDNTEENTQSKNTVKELLHLPHVQYFHDGENKGLSFRLNHAATLAKEQSCQWLLTMDQDSFFPEGSFAAYLNCLKDYNSRESTAMFGVAFGQEAIWSRHCAAEDVEQLITSGSILNLLIFEKTGPFDEALFIDRVDQEYCLRARLLHYKIIRFNNIFLQHNLGVTTTGRSFKSLKRTPRSLHSPVRLYYMFRNYLYLKDKYGQQDPTSIAFMKKELLLRIKNNLIYGKRRVELIRFLYKALSDYKSRMMGKLKG
jgi:rhamnosyltransferase